MFVTHSKKPHVHLSTQKKQFLVFPIDGAVYVNVNLFTNPGIARAERLMLTPSRVSDFGYTGLLKESTVLFDPFENFNSPVVWGRLMVMIRDPIERSINRYEQFVLSSGNTGYSLSMFANSPIYKENNPLVRSLIGIGSGDTLEQKHMDAAQAVIDNLVLVGIFEQFEESIDQWEKFLGWSSVDKADEVRACRTGVMQAFGEGYTIQQDYTKIDPVGYNLIVASHRWDKLLYNYAVQVFEAQKSQLVFASTT